MLADPVLEDPEYLGEIAPFQRVCIEIVGGCLRWLQNVRLLHCCRLWSGSLSCVDSAVTRTSSGDFGVTRQNDWNDIIRSRSSQQVLSCFEAPVIASVSGITAFNTFERVRRQMAQSQDKVAISGHPGGDSDLHVRCSAVYVPCKLIHEDDARQALSWTR